MWNRGVAQQGQLMLQSKMLGVQCRAPPIESRVPWGVPEYSSHGNTNTTVLGHPSAFTALLSTSWDVLGCPSRLPQRSLPVYHAQCVPAVPRTSWDVMKATRKLRSLRPPSGLRTRTNMSRTATTCSWVSNTYVYYPSMFPGCTGHPSSHTLPHPYSATTLLFL